VSERCSDVSLAVGESLSATATVAEHWLLVEVRGGWSRDVGTSEALPEAARAAVSAWLEVTPRSRLLFVRRPARTAGPHLVFVVTAPESGGSVRRFELDALDDLANVDLVGGGAEHAAPLVLVCGHGSRDACCALRGTAVFGALAPDLGDEEVWISSHQGGHRFAANVIVLPAAVHLGRIESSEAQEVVGRALAGAIDLDRYRGRTCHAAPVQAAENAVRVAHGLERLDDLGFLERSGSTVRFRDAEGREHAAEVTETPGPSVPVSCGSDPEPQPAFAVRLL
jgi:hypothetical protein